MSMKVSVSKRIKTESSDQTKKLSREEWRKAKELEEARKAGTAPAAVDEEGKDINPHIPQYISTVPWYYNSDTPTLKHQRPQVDHEKSHSSINEWYQRGVNKQSVAKKFRKGACSNCGAMGHEKKNCFERPRKLEAQFNNRNIAPDDFVQKQLDLSYDGKRDRWAGYDPTDHKLIIEEYERIEEAKRKLRTEKLNDETHDDNPVEKDVDNDDEDEDKYVDEIEMVGTKVDNKQRITVRNLRIREDTAKYLYNLDQNSAYYDPKTRAMRDNPHKNTNKVDPEYKGENFVRFTGDTVKHSQAQLFAWEVSDKGVDINLLAEPTKLELLQKEFDKKKDVFKSQIKQTIFNQYGGEEYLGSNTDALEKSLLLAQTEDYVEYSREGKVIKGNIKPVIRSKYPEDQYNNNHTTVWGSFWKEGQWGYKCCFSTIKNSFCIGNKSTV